MLRIIHSNNHPPLRVAIIGAESLGIAIAGMLATQGHNVSIYSENPVCLHPIIIQNGVRIMGNYSGFGKIETCTTSLEEALYKSEVIIQTLPASETQKIAKSISRFLTDNQLILLINAQSFGAWEFRQALIQQNCFAQVTIAETQSTIIKFKKANNTCYTIDEIESPIPVATIKSDQVYTYIKKLRALIPHFVPVENTFITSLSDIRNFHFPVLLAINNARVSSKESLLDKYNLQESINQIFQSVDKERLGLIEVLGFKAQKTTDWIHNFKKLSGVSLLQNVILNNDYLLTNSTGIPSTYSINSGILFNYVPLVSLGRMLGISVKTSESIVNLCSELTNQKFMQTGRTVDTLGISGMNLGEIQQFASGNHDFSFIRHS